MGVPGRWFGRWAAVVAVGAALLVLAPGAVAPQASAAGARPGAGFQALSPARLLDTRPGTSTIDNRYVGTGPIGTHGALAIQVAGRGGVPAAGATAVVLNVTATAPTATTFVTVWPTGGRGDGAESPIAAYAEA